MLPRYKTATVEAWGALKARWAEENVHRLDNWSAVGRCVLCDCLCMYVKSGCERRLGV